MNYRALCNSPEHSISMPQSINQPHFKQNFSCKSTGSTSSLHCYHIILSEKSVGHNNDLINSIVSPLRHRPIWSFSFSHKRENCRKQMTSCVATVNHICWNTSFPSDLELLQLQSDHTVQNHSIFGLHQCPKYRI